LSKATAVGVLAVIVVSGDAEGVHRSDPVVGGNGPVAPPVRLGVRGVEVRQAEGQIGLVRELVLAAAVDDLVVRRVADLQAAVDRPCS
jgi:hypothetical protein